MNFKVNQEELDKLKKSVPLWAAAQNRLKGMQKRGQEYDFLCPWHNDTHPTFQVFQKEDGWLGHCQSCGITLNIFQLIEKLDGISFQKAVELVKEMAAPSREWEKKKSEVDAVFGQVKAISQITTIPIANFQTYIDALFASKEGLDWLKSRGISEDIARRFSLGYVQTPLSVIVPAQHPWADKGWLLMPEVRNGEVVAVKYRSVIGKKIKYGTMHYSGFAQRPGMMRSPLYNIENITSLDALLIVEGEIDCWTLSQAGFTSVSLPSASSNVNAEMRVSLMGSNSRYLAGDMDEPGVAAMSKLYKELGGENPNKARTFWLKWPTPHKDANEFFLVGCAGDVDKFKSEVLLLMQEAKSRHIEGIRDLKEVMQNAKIRPTHSDPKRMSFPWPNIDKWVDILPGEVCFMFATETKMGKSTWWENILVHNALRGKKIVNFSAELSPDRYAQMVTANLLQKDRKALTTDDMQSASEKMPEDSFYFGYKPGAKMGEVLKLLAESKQVYGGDIFVIDPLHFIIRDSDNENRDTAAAMKACVDFAIKWDVIMIVVGQARKSMSGARGKMAQGQDARGTAALGEDAATTFVLHRNRKAGDGDESSPVYENKTCIKLDYSRNSEPRSGYLMFDGETATFRECISEPIDAPKTRAQELEEYFYDEEADATS